MIDVVNEKRALMEPYANVADEVTENLQFHANSDIDPLLEEHGRVEEEAAENEMEEGHVTLGGDQLINVNAVKLTQSVSNIENDGIINSKIRSLEIKQRQVFDIVHRLARDFMKY